LVANLPRMLGEIAATFIGRQRDMELIWNSTGNTAITPAQAVALRIDVLVLTADGDARAAAAAYLEARPALRVICVAEDGRSALRYYRSDTRTDGGGGTGTSATVVEERIADIDRDRLMREIRETGRAG
jgi:hypothetical protein